MQVFEVSGSPYRMGQQIGRRFRRVLQRKCVRAEAKWMNDEMQGKLAAIEMKLEQSFPEALEEIRGKAEGAEVPLSTLLLLNSPELLLKEDGCTTVIMKDSAGRPFLSHNEDEDAFYKNNTMLVRYNYPDHWIIAYTCAEKLPGSCFGFNSHGLIFSSNYLFPDRVDAKEISRYIYEYTLLSSASVAEVRSRLDRMRAASPFSFNVIDTKTGEASNFEKDLDCYYETVITSPYGRSNHFLKKEGEVRSSQSSLFRASWAQTEVSRLDPADLDIEKLRQILCHNEKEYNRSVLLKGKKNRTVVNFSYSGADGSIVILDYLDHGCAYHFNLQTLLNK